MSKTPKKPRVPSYRRHKRSGQAVVTISGKDIYLGKYGSAKSQAEYNRLIAEWAASGGSSVTTDEKSDIAVSELLSAFLKHAKAYHNRCPRGLLCE